MLRVSMHQPNFLPYIGFFDKIRRSDLFIIVDHCTFSKGRDNWHHRNRIRTCNNGGWDYITVPVSEHYNWRPFHEARISDVFAFRRKKHLKTIYQSYHRAPFFDSFFDEFREAYTRDVKNLAEFNTDLIMWLLEKFRIRTEVLRSTELDFNNGLRKTDMIIGLMRMVDGTHFLSGDGAREYIDPEDFRRAGIRLEFQNFSPEPYPQAYPGFVPYLSALDLLFNTGKLGPNGQQKAESPAAIPVLNKPLTTS
jgi:hypothetical protein